MPTIDIPANLYKEIKEDAFKKRRTVKAHMAFILDEYYGLEPEPRPETTDLDEAEEPTASTTSQPPQAKDKPVFMADYKNGGVLRQTTGRTEEEARAMAEKQGTFVRVRRFESEAERWAWMVEHDKEYGV